MSTRRPAPPRPRSRVTNVLVGLLGLVLLAALAACGGDESEDEARGAPPLPPPSTLVALPSATPDEEASATAASRAASEAEAEEREASGLDPSAGPATLPAAGEAPVLQLARIEHSAWEPEILAQMTPHLSLQANGFLVFSSPYGGSEDGWYQTVITPQETEALLRIFMDEIGVLELAESRGEPPIVFETAADGEPEGCEAYGVIYVRSAEREGRLLISECEVEDAEGPEADRLRKLLETVNLLERWKNVADHERLTEDQQTAFRSLLGFYSAVRQPYTPDSAVAYGVAAREDTPEDALSAVWPLEIGLDETDFPGRYGRAPAELLLEPPDSTALLREGLVFESVTPRSFWGPLFRGRDAEGEELRYLVGVRPAVPGSNHVVVDYEYELPRLDMEQLR